MINLNSLVRSLKKVYPQSVPRNRKDYPSAVDEDDLDASSSIEVLPIRTILYNHHQGLGLSSAEEDCFNVFDDDETNLDRCHAVLCDPKESATQYFINDEDLLFGRLVLNSDSDDDGFNNQHGGGEDDGHAQQEDSDIETELSEEDNMLFGSGASGWDSDETVTDAQFFLHIRRERVQAHTEAEEIADVALRETVQVSAEDGAKYFDADDLFEQEEETLVYGRDGWYSEDWDL